MNTDLARIIETLIPNKKVRQGDLIVNTQKIDSLAEDLRLDVELELLNKVKEEEDLLILETLVYMNSEGVISILEDMINESSSIDSIIYISLLFRLGHGSVKLENTAYNNFLKVKDKYSLISLFYYLTDINSPKINDKIKEYTKSRDVLLSHNSKKALESTI